METTPCRALLTIAVLALLALAAVSYAATPDAVTPDGGRYYGPLVDGKMHGRGRVEWANGARYEGRFENGSFHGPGRYTDPQGNTYEGSFVNGSLEGRGKVTGSGGVYEGELKQWRFHGRGVLRHANGDAYEGNFVNGVCQGHDDERRRIESDVEAAMYAQKRLLDKALASLKRSQPGKINMYLLAVAGYGPQEVFRREVEFVQKAFAERFGTAARSVVLVNSRNTVTSAPMATVTSIGAALKAIAARMDPEKDILFMFLTSHGSEAHELSLSQRGMQLRDLRAAELGKLLEESGIRWKVVLMSACYSGGFIDALRDERTLVITAARRDRRSFGCADENDFTYFGRAFFKEALPGARSFQQAFARASLLVDEWERKDVARNAMAAGKNAKAADESRSLPQIHSPARIEAHLARWWAQLPPGFR